MMKRVFLIQLLLVVAISGCEEAGQSDGVEVKEKAHIERVEKPGNIICFGNSLTKGQGSGRGKDYPAVLASMVDRPVINAGVNGDTTGNGLARIEEDVLSRDPYMVLIELGPNDKFQEVPEDIVMLNLELIVEKVLSSGAIAVICNMGDGGSDNRYDIYSRQMKALAEATGALYVGDLLAGLRQDPRFMTDQIHPNDEGYRVIAERIHEAIRDYL